MYVVKVGEYYVRGAGDWSSDVVLSQEIMRTFTKETADKLAKKLNGVAIEMTDEVTNGED